MAAFSSPKPGTRKRNTCARRCSGRRRPRCDRPRRCCLRSTRVVPAMRHQDRRGQRHDDVAVRRQAPGRCRRCGPANGNASSRPEPVTGSACHRATTQVADQAERQRHTAPPATTTVLPWKYASRPSRDHAGARGVSAPPASATCCGSLPSGRGSTGPERLRVFDIGDACRPPAASLPAMCRSRAAPPATGTTTAPPPC